MTFPDRLADAVQRSGTCLCVGIDPRVDRLPHAVRAVRNPYEHAEQAAAAAVERFAFRVLELVRPYCGVVKPQAAFFELLGPAGVFTLQRVLWRAKEMGFVTVLDAKRGDVGETARAYADAAFVGGDWGGERFRVWDADALTVNPYLGADAVDPFLAAAAAADRGVFVLVRTSNPGAGRFQDLACGGKPVYRHVADAVAGWNAGTLGECRLGRVGAVVGATHPAELAELRAALPDCWLLVPGYGAQGGTAADVRAGLRPDGLGAVVNSSRGVTFPFAPDDPDWEAKVRAAAGRSAAELRVG